MSGGAPTRERKCKICGDLFVARRGAKTCSAKCRKRLQRQKQSLLKAVKVESKATPISVTRIPAQIIASNRPVESSTPSKASTSQINIPKTPTISKGKISFSSLSSWARVAAVILIGLVLTTFAISLKDRNQIGKLSSSTSTSKPADSASSLDVQDLKTQVGALESKISASSPNIDFSSGSVSNAQNSADSDLLGGNSSSYYTNASNISSGTLSNSRLSSTVTLQGNSFNGAGQLVQLSSTGALPAVDGSQLTGLPSTTNASSLTSGTLGDARLSSNVALLDASNTFSGTTNTFSNQISLGAASSSSGKILLYDSSNSNTVTITTGGTTSTYSLTLPISGPGATNQCLQSGSTTASILEFNSCSAGGSGDNISVNGTNASDANFIDVAASGSVAGTSWTLSAAPSPDTIALNVSNASGTQAGVVTTGTQTFAGAKTFSGLITASGGVSGNVTGNVTGSSGSTTGNAATATALAANPTDCAANQFAYQIDAGGNLTCSAVDAGTLSGTTLKSTVVNSSLTSVGTLSSLTVSGNADIATTGASNVTIATGTGTVGIGNTTGAATLTGGNNSYIALTPSASSGFNVGSTDAATAIKSSSASALTIGRQGATSPALQVDSSTALSVTGLKVTAAAAGGGLDLSTIGGNSAENLTISAKGSGTTTIASGSTGDVQFFSSSNKLTSGGNLTVAGAVTAGTYNGNTFNSSGALTFGNAGTATIQPASSQALTITGHASSSWTLDGGDLTLDATAASANVKLGTGAQAKTIQIGTTSANTGNTQTIDIGNLNAAGTTNVTVGTGSSATAGTTTVQAKGALTITGGAASTWSTSSGNLTIQSGSALALDTAGSSGITVGGTNATSIVLGGNTSATITEKVASSSSTAYLLQTAGGTAYLTANTSSTYLVVGSGGSGNGTGTPVVLVLANKNTAGDPTGTDGAMYYNSYLRTFRCNKESTWYDCNALPKPSDRRMTYNVARGASTCATSGIGDGTVSVSVAGSGACGGLAATNTDPTYLNMDPGTTGSSRASINLGGGGSSPNPQHNSSTLSIAQWDLKPLTNANERIWVGLHDLAGSNLASDSPTGNIIGFRFSTAAGDTTWRCIASDGTISNTDSTVSVVAGTRYKFEIDQTTVGTLVYKINGSNVCTFVVGNGDHVPSNVNLGYCVSVMNTDTNVHHNVYTSYFYSEETI